MPRRLLGRCAFGGCDPELPTPVSGEILPAVPVGKGTYLPRPGSSIATP